MAQVTEIRLVDDLDGGNADESVDFTVDNNRYQMDLSERNAARLREVLAPFIAAARRAGGSTTTRTRRSATGARPSGAGAETAAIREWAGVNRIQRVRAVPDRRLGVRGLREPGSLDCCTGCPDADGRSRGKAEAPVT